MIVKTYIAGPIQANNYLVYDETSKEAVLIDCSEKKQELLDDIKNLGLNVKYILLTHGHFDHVLGVNDMQKELNAPAYVDRLDIPQVENTSAIMAAFGIQVAKNPEITHFLDENENFTIADTKINILKTPGHTEGGVCYLIDDKLFSGDTLFCESVGRTDLMGGDFNKLHKSVVEVLFNLDEDITVYPGHGPSTTIGYEKKNNEIIHF